MKHMTVKNERGGGSSTLPRVCPVNPVRAAPCSGAIFEPRESALIWGGVLLLFFKRVTLYWSKADEQCRDSFR